MNQETRQALWTEAASTVTNLDNILHNRGEASPYKKFYKEDPVYKKHWRTFGEQGVITLTSGITMKSKLQDRGIKAIFLGYAANHTGNVYRMQNLETKKILITRDVKWLDKMQGKEIGGDDTYQLDDEDIQIQLTEETQEDHLQDPPEEEKEEIEPIAQDNQEPERPPRFSRAVKALQPYNRPGCLKQEGEIHQFCFCVPEGANDLDDTPTTFKDAWHHKDLKKREKWREAIRLECGQMGKTKVWQKEILSTYLKTRK